MIHRRVITVITALLFCISSVFAQSDWTLQQNEDGIAIYTKDKEGYSLKAYKATTLVNATPEDMLHILTDFENLKTWLHLCRESRLLKRLDNDRYIYYVEFKTPWPLSNRDYVNHLSVNHLPSAIVVNIHPQPDYLPEKEGIVRIKKSYTQWSLVAKEHGVTEVTLESCSEPEGMVPAWMTNAGILEWPHATLMNLKEKVGHMSNLSSPRLSHD
jgi:hypothetical protein